jgi:hypothetical protein
VSVEMVNSTVRRLDYVYQKEKIVEILVVLSQLLHKEEQELQNLIIHYETTE